jgi:hydroxypyruvate reductase
VVSLLISDIPGDDPSVIASGPTVPDPTTFADAAGILERYGLTGEHAAYEALKAAAEETPKPGDPRLARAEIRMVATPQKSLEAAAEVAREAGVTPLILGDSIEGEAKDVALVHAGMARQVALRGQPAAAPCVLVSGGETTVTVRGKGRGGRNAEFLLALTVAVNGAPGIFALAGDTDGIDGTEDNAGAITTPDSLARAEKIGVNARAHLADNDGYGFFSALGDLVVTGPTLTNVNDFRAILVTGAY